MSPDNDVYPRRLRLLDLFCGAGGAAMGYYRAGFEVVGVDINPQPHYPFEFHQDDALATIALPGMLNVRLGHFDAIHASPPCQAFSAMSNSRPGLAQTYPRYIEPVRELLLNIGIPYIIENVRGAYLINPTMLTGGMFGLPLKRDRLFETSWTLPLILAASHDRPVSRAGHWRPGTLISVAGNCAPIEMAREAMGIDWMNRDELAEAIPPAYTEWIGRNLIDALNQRPDLCVQGGDIGVVRVGVGQRLASQPEKSQLGFGDGDRVGHAGEYDRRLKDVKP